MQYSANGGIANGLLETDWKDVGAGFNKDTVYNVVIEADFDKKYATPLSLTAVKLLK